MVPLQVLAVILGVLTSVYASLELPHVTCTSILKLENQNHLVRLHSHDVKYGTGSGQQSVTATTEKDDHNSYWVVKGPKDNPCGRGDPVECNAVIRLEHLSTQKNLHSHHFSSPLSGNQEISAFGKVGEGDSGDNWKVYCSSTYWPRDTAIRLKHVDTDMWLSLSGQSFGRPIAGQMEVIGSSYSDQSAYWKTQEGVFVKQAETGMGSFVRDSSEKIPVHTEL